MNEIGIYQSEEKVNTNKKFDMAVMKLRKCQLPLGYCSEDKK